VILRRAHDLDFSFEIADAGRGVIATHFEEVLVVVPRHVVQDYDGIGVGGVVVIAKCGRSRHK
jgi:hypothetical protein